MASSPGALPTTLFRNATRIFAGLVVAVGVSSCSCSDTAAPEEEEPRASSVTLTPSSIALAFIGDTEQLTATVRDQDGNTLAGQTVTWSSDELSVAQVSVSGVVQAVGTGSARVTARSGSLSASASVTVSQVPASVTVSPDSVAFAAAGDSAQLSAQVLDGGGAAVAGAVVSWSAVDTTVATVSASGTVTSRRSGVTPVTATAAGVSDSAVIVVDRVPVSVVVTPEAFTLNAVGQTVQLDGRVLDANQLRIDESALEWSSSDTAAVMVDTAGLVTAVASGVAQVVAVADALTDTAAITVDQTAGSVRLTPAELIFVSLGDTTRIAAEVLDAGGALVPGASVSWTSSDTLVAVVSDLGTVTALGNGAATITAESGTATGLAPVTVGQVVASLEVSPVSLGFSSVGDTARIVVSARDARDNPVPGAAIEYASSDAGVATVGPDGLVTSVSDGAASIRVSAQGAEEEVPVTVSQAAATLTLTPDTVRFDALGATAALIALVQDSAGSTIPAAPVTWMGSDGDVAEVDDAGRLTSTGNGAAFVTATAGAATDTAWVEVEQIPVALAIAPDSLVLEAVGDTLRLVVAVTDSEGTAVEGAVVVWESGDPDAVAVSADGLLTAVASGPSVVRGSLDALSDSLVVRTRGSYLDVTVLGDGDPVPDAAVQLTDPLATVSLRTTDSSGVVRFRNLEVGNHDVAVATPPEGWSSQNDPRTVAVGPDVAVSTTFDGIFAPAAVSGSATSWGIPVAGAQVRFEGRDTVVVTVDGAGAFAIDSIARGDYQASISGFSGVRFRQAVQSVFLPSVVTTQVDFVAKPDPEPVWDGGAAGIQHSCGVTTENEIYCWGVNASSQLGNGSAESASTPQLVDGPGLSFTAVAAGNAHTCALVTGGAAYCWGEGNDGRLGTGFVDDEATPRAVTGGLTFSGIEAGGAHTCALTAAGAGYCWGLNASGQAGTGRTTVAGVPTAVAGGAVFIDLSAGSAHSCAVNDAGQALCWGRNTFGQLGDGSLAGDSVPVPVLGGHTFTEVSAGSGHSCGVTDTQDIYCWGRGDEGQLGDGTTTATATAPVLVVGGHDFVEVGAGSFHTCGRTSSGGVYCWGEGVAGQLGDGLATASSSPVLVSGGLDLSVLAPGGSHTCAVGGAGLIYCWGLGDAGQLGTGDTANEPDPVRAGGNW